MQEEQTKMGQTIYETICKMFDENNFPYERHDSDHVITCKARGEDLPMDFVFDVWDERQVVKLYSTL